MRKFKKFLFYFQQKNREISHGRFIMVITIISTNISFIILSNRQNDNWKSGRSMSSGGCGGGYGGSSSYQRNMPSSDYTRKYQNNPSIGQNYDSSPPPHKRNKKEW